MLPDYAGRRSRALSAARAADADAFLVTDVVNVAYLTGFSGSNAALALAEDVVVLITDRRYADQVEAEAPDVDLVVARQVASRGLDVLRDASGDQPSVTVAVEADHVSQAEFSRLSAGSPGVTLRPVPGMVAGLRRTRDAFEIGCSTRACRIVVEALTQLTEHVRAGSTERSLAGRMEWIMREAGADDRAFPTIVASGPNSAVPHHAPNDRLLEVGDLVKIDAGARWQGYHSDLTRTFVVAAEPNGEQRRIHRAVKEAAEVARTAVRPGRATSDLYRMAGERLAEYGLADRFIHGLGHGVGLRVHEAPMLSAESAGTIVEGDVLTVEPGVYLPGFGGVRIEDTVLVTSDGHECLTDMDRELRSLG